MNKISKTPVALAVTAAFATPAVNAAIISVKLERVWQTSSSGTEQGFLTGDTATWKFNSVTGRVFQKSGTYQTTYFVAGVTPVLSNFITGLEVGSGLDAAATSFSCVEGNFGSHVGASICGNYNFGPGGQKASNESSTTWGPGTAFARTIGGDDVPLGPQQNLSVYDGMTTSWNGGTSIELLNYDFGGMNMEFSTIPVPAAVWLFGSALGLLGWLRWPKLK